MTNLDAALLALNEGKSIFPLYPRSKTPHSQLLPLYTHADGRVYPSWKPFQTERATPADVRHWFSIDPNCGIGMATGELSGVIAIDADSPDGLEWATRALPADCPRVQGSEVHKVHFYLRHPGFRVKNSVCDLAEGVDVRGDGGFVVMPPSVHPSGAVYQWLTENRARAPNAPDWMLKRWQAATQEREAAPVARITIDNGAQFDRLERYVRTAFQNEVRAVENAADGTKHDQLNKSVFSIAGFLPHGLLDEGEIKAAFFDAVHSRAANKSDALKTIERAIRDGQMSPRRLNLSP